ncbi:hypothetical protein HDU91_003734, partial [Kappamyces sp. JEL0680]
MVGTQLGKMTGHRRSVEDLEISPEYLYSCSSDASIRKWSLATGEEVGQLLGHQTSIYKLAGSFDDEILWSVSGDKTAVRWDLTTGSVDATLPHPDFVKSIAILPNGFVATGCRDENIRVWNPSTESCVAFIPAHFGEVSCIKVSGLSGTFYTSSLDTTIRTWNLQSVLQTETPAPPVQAASDSQPKDDGLTEEERRELE